MKEDEVVTLLSLFKWKVKGNRQSKEVRNRRYYLDFLKLYILVFTDSKYISKQLNPNTNYKITILSKDNRFWINGVVNILVVLHTTPNCLYLFMSVW